MDLMTKTFSWLCKTRKMMAVESQPTIDDHKKKKATHLGRLMDLLKSIDNEMGAALETLQRERAPLFGELWHMPNSTYRGVSELF